MLEKHHVGAGKEVKSYYPDPILAGRLAIAKLQELYTEAAQSCRRTDPSQRHQQLVRASIGRWGALRMSLGTWLERIAQPDPQSAAGMATGQAPLIARLLQAIKAWSLQRAGQKEETAASCPRPGCPVNGASAPEVELHRGQYPSDTGGGRTRRVYRDAGAGRQAQLPEAWPARDVGSGSRELRSPRAIMIGGTPGRVGTGATHAGRIGG